MVNNNNNNLAKKKTLEKIGDTSSFEKKTERGDSPLIFPAFAAYLLLLFFLVFLSIDDAVLYTRERGKLGEEGRALPL